MLRDEVTKEPLYRQVAHSIEQQVGRGVLRVGDKVSSVRAFSKHNKVSMSTVLQAYFWLERHGYIEPWLRSGFYVRVLFKELIREPKYREHEAVFITVGTTTIIHE